MNILGYSFVSVCDSGNFCSHSCTSIPYSYYCSCWSGYYLNTTDKSSCHDINECEEGTHECDVNTKCSNTEGSYRCTENVGSTGDGICTVGVTNCHTNAECYDRDGSYNCECTSGYSGNGTFCEDINECEIGIHNCTNDDYCLNMPGSYECYTHQQATNGLILGAVLVSLFTLMICGIVVFVVCKKRTKKRNFTFREKARAAGERPLPEAPSSISLPPMDLFQQLQEQLHKKNKLYRKHDLQLSKIIGEGESGLVYRGCLNNRQLVAVKTGKVFMSHVEKERIIKEVTLMISLDHPNVMSIVGMCFDGEAPLLIMPFMLDGSVLDFVRKKKDNLYFTDESCENEVATAQKQCLNVCHQIAKGMSYLAMKRLVHRDLAARNCMLNGGIVKVADFGLAEDMYGLNYYRHNSSEVGERVPIRWMAPETINSNIYNEATDVWSYGVTCWEVFTCGRVPYTGVPAMTLLTELQSGHRLDRPTNITCSDEMWEIMGLCWLANSQQRPKFSDLTGKLYDLLDSDTSYLRL